MISNTAIRPTTIKLLDGPVTRSQVKKFKDDIRAYIEDLEDRPGDLKGMISHFRSFVNNPSQGRIHLTVIGPNPGQEDQNTAQKESGSQFEQLRRNHSDPNIPTPPLPIFPTPPHYNIPTPGTHIPTPLTLSDPHPINQHSDPVLQHSDPNTLSDPVPTQLNLQIHSFHVIFHSSINR